MTNPRRAHRAGTPEHRKSMKDIHLGIEKTNRKKRIAKLRAKLAINVVDDNRLRKNSKYPENRASFLDSKGDFISGGTVKSDGFRFEHSDLADKIEGIKSNVHGQARNDRTIDFMKKNNSVRVHDSGTESDFQVETPINRTQLNRIRSFLKDSDPDKYTTFDVVGNSADNFKDFSKLLKKHKFLKGKLAKMKQKVAGLRAFTNSSSFVGNMRYDSDEQTLTGILSGKHYMWCDVPERKFDSFMGAGSAGAYFNRSLKGQHDCSSGGILSSLKSRISKMTRLNSGIDIEDGMAQINMNGRDIINLAREWGVEKTERGRGFTFLPKENKVIDAYNPQGAQELLKKFPGKGKLALISRTTNIDKLDDLVDGLEGINLEGLEPLVGGFNNPKTGKFEFDATFAKRFENDNDIQNELLKTNQFSGLIIDDEGNVSELKNPQYKTPEQIKKNNRINKLRGAIQKMAAKGDIIPPNIRQSSPYTKLKDHTILTPKKFLDLSANADASGIGKNSGVITGLNDVHSGGVEKSDESDPLIKHNPIKGISRDDREPIFKHRDKRKPDNERGDELGSVESYRRQLRRPEGVSAPFLSVRNNKVDAHEGRHRARAMIEEGIEATPVEIGEGFMNTDPGRKRTQNEVNSWTGEESSSVPTGEDTRNPILGRFSKLRMKLAQVKLAGFGRPPQRILDAFKNKQADATKAFVSDGKRLLYNGNEVARHTRKGIEVSYAGYNSATTAATIRGLGIDTRTVKGVTTINGQKIDPDSTDFTLVPTKNINDKPFRISTGPTKRVTDRRLIDEQEQFRRQMRIRETGSPTEVPEDPTVIQPRDQKYINHITGVKSPIPRKTLGVDAHHMLPKENFPGLRRNINNAIPLSKKRHKEVGELNRGLLRKSRLKLATVKSKINLKKGMIQLAKNQSADSIINAFRKYRAEHPDSLGSGVYDPIENRILDARIPIDAIRLQRFFESGTNKIGFNSITDTRQGPATDIDLIHSQLKEVEQSGGIPALGFDEGSLEALNVQVNTTDKEILSALLEHQRSTGILDGDLTFRIVDNEKFRLN